MDFQKAYARDNWINFLQTKFLPDDFVTDIEEDLGLKYKFKYIEKAHKLGECESLDLKVYEVRHKSAYDPRISLTRESFKLMSSYAQDRALVLFVSENSDQYRFSLITLQYKEKDNKIVTELSNPRRFSFIMGKDAKLGTIYDRLLDSKTISDTTRIQNFNDLKERFSVEKVSKQFFKEYKKLYENVKDTFNQIPTFKIVAQKHVESGFLDTFSRKLLGQIVFIYFLQRKKWLGGNPSINNWEDGKENFLRWAFTYCEKNNINFFDKFLENLFYNGFNAKEVSFEFDGMYIKVPFLNGGLFEKYYEIDDTIIFNPPNTLFSNEEKTGILDVFDRYNFTIDENIFFEKEVAVDPEMLGKVFENLLPENLRKGKGSYYTPREIVSYMTRESLIVSLKSHLKEQFDGEVKDEEIEQKVRRLFRYKDFYIKKGESEQFGKKFEEQFYDIYDIVEKVNEYLRDLKIVDPAVGSGAFPMGILKEIVFSREYIENEFLGNSISHYRLKKETIQNTIYGVDIDPGAVEIAKLRFWLSLVVDADKPEPLPNLDYKIMQGNSLVENFSGINVSDITNLKNNDIELLKEKKLIDDLHKKQNELYNATDRIEKEKLREEIEEDIIEIYHTFIEEGKEGYYQNYNKIIKQANSLPNKKLREEYIKNEKAKLEKKYEFDFSQADKILHNFSKKDKIRPFFPWHLYFADVFKYNKGFDIVIGNPPYIQLQKAFNENVKFADLFTDQNFKTFSRTGDIYCLFYEKGYELLANKGHLCFITSNKWMRAKYGKKLRKFFANNTNPKIIIDLSGYKVFEAATVDTNIIIFEKNNVKNNIANACIIKEDFKTKSSENDESENNMADYVKNNSINLNNFSEKSWIISTPEELVIKKKIEKNGTPLKNWNLKIHRGILTGYNKAFIIDGYKKDELIAKDPKNAEIIKPILRGRDIKKYQANFAGLWLINTHNGLKREHLPRVDVVENYPVIKEYLDTYWKKLKKRQDQGDTPYNLRNCSYIKKFEKEKIVYSEIVHEPQFYFDSNDKFFAEATSFIMTGEDIKYLISMFNSKFITFCFKNFYSGGKLGKKGLRYKKAFLINVPIKKLSKERQKPFINLVDKILEEKKNNPEADTSEYENQIDLMVYKLYKLTYEEVKIVDPEIDKVLSQFSLRKEDYEKMSVEELAELRTI